MKEGWEENAFSNFEYSLQAAMEDVQPLRQQHVNIKDVPAIVNVVSTVSILPPGYKLPLEALSMLSCSQFAPRQFAANILKITTSITNSTALVFQSGKIVLVSGLSCLHSVYIGQLFRLLIERIQCILQTTDGIRVGTLSGRTIFEQHTVHNIVGNGNLGARIDLKALRDANPGCVKWLPDGFPAAKCSVWLTETNRCCCSKKEKAVGDEEVAEVLRKVIKKKCACTIKCLVFESGRIIMIGGRTVNDINSVFFRMKRLVPQYRNAAVATPFEQLFGSMMVHNVAADTDKVCKSDVMSEAELFAIVMHGGGEEPPLLKRPRYTEEPLFTFADKGMLDNLIFTLEVDPEMEHALDSEGRTVLERLLNMPARTEKHNEIIKVLQGRGHGGPHG